MSNFINDEFEIYFYKSDYSDDSDNSNDVWDFAYSWSFWSYVAWMDH